MHHKPQPPQRLHPHGNHNASPMPFLHILLFNIIKRVMIRRDRSFTMPQESPPNHGRGLGVTQLGFGHHDGGEEEPCGVVRWIGVTVGLRTRRWRRQRAKRRGWAGPEEVQRGRWWEMAVARARTERRCMDGYGDGGVFARMEGWRLEWVAHHDAERESRGFGWFGGKEDVEAMQVDAEERVEEVEELEVILSDGRRG
ncbi:hypothetical protein BC829DRAFT_434154 [Chytridium lagenaria]|nr:hypothetical protein BC829DRAFT_434154 [Chytridium lagenaria]